MVVLVVIAEATPMPMPSGPLDASVTLAPRLPTVTTGHCWRSLLNDNIVMLLFEVFVVELCCTASQYSPALSEVLNGTLRYFGPVTNALHPASALEVEKLDVPPVESVRQDSPNVC